MSLLRAKGYLKEYGKDKDIIEFNQSSAIVMEAAQAIGCKESDIAKSLSFIAQNSPILVVMAGDKRCDNHKYRTYFHEKAHMLPKDNLVELIGHEAGGVCPFGVNDGVKIYLDISLKEHRYIYPACGSANSAIKLTLEELENTVDYIDWIDITK